MRFRGPEISRANIRIGLDHPNFIWLFLRGLGYTELVKAHFAVHFREIADMEIGYDETDPLGLVCQSIDLCSKSEYPLLYLYLVCRHIRPDAIVETGVQYGVSSAAMLKALQEVGGHLYSIDLPNVSYPEETERALPAYETGFLIPEPLKANWTLISGDSRKELPSLLRSIGGLRIFHHDGMHTYDNMMFEFETVWPYLGYDGLLLAHNVDMNSAFKDFCQNHKADYRIRGPAADVGVARKTEAST